MKQRTETEMLWAAALKIIRNQVRLRYSILADQELNEIMPQLEQDFTRAIQLGRGQEFVLGLGEEL